MIKLAMVALARMKKSKEQNYILHILESSLRLLYVPNFCNPYRTGVLYYAPHTVAVILARILQDTYWRSIN